jgi:hypothetical protein
MDHLDFRIVEQLLCVRVRGQLTKDMYETLASLVKQQVQQHGAICVLMELCEFRGWADEAEWKDANFDPWQWLGISVRHWSASRNGRWQSQSSPVR